MFTCTASERQKLFCQGYSRIFETIYKSVSVETDCIRVLDVGGMDYIYSNDMFYITPPYIFYVPKTNLPYHLSATQRVVDNYYGNEDARRSLDYRYREHFRKIWAEIKNCVQTDFTQMSLPFDISPFPSYYKLNMINNSIDFGLNIENNSVKIAAKLKLREQIDVAISDFIKANPYKVLKLDEINRIIENDAGLQVLIPDEINEEPKTKRRFKSNVIEFKR